MTRDELATELENILYSQGICVESECVIDEIVDFILDNFIEKSGKIDELVNKFKEIARNLREIHCIPITTKTLKDISDEEIYIAIANFILANFIEKSGKIYEGYLKIYGDEVFIQKENSDLAKDEIIALHSAKELDGKECVLIIK